MVMDFSKAIDLPKPIILKEKKDKYPELIPYIKNFTKANHEKILLKIKCPSCKGIEVVSFYGYQVIRDAKTNKEIWSWWVPHYACLECGRIW